MYIKKEIYPYEMRFGIGIGEITTQINPAISLGADGPSYYKARNSLETLKKIENQKEVAFTDILIGIDGESENVSQELALNTIFKLMSAIEKKMDKGSKRNNTLYPYQQHHSIRNI